MKHFNDLFVTLKKFFNKDYKFYRLKQTIILLIILSMCFLLIKILSFSICRLTLQSNLSLNSNTLLFFINNIGQVNNEYFVMIFSGSLTILVLSFSLSQFMIERLSNSFSLKILDEYENNILIYYFYYVQIISVLFNLMIIICSLYNIFLLIMSLIIFLVGLYLLIDYINTIYYFSNPKNMINILLNDIEEYIIKFDYNNYRLSDEILYEKWKKSYENLNEKYDLINDFLILYLNKEEYLFVKQIYTFMFKLIKNEVGRFQMPSFLSNYLIVKYFDICYMIISYENIDLSHVKKIESDLQNCFHMRSLFNTKRLFFDSDYYLSMYYELNKGGTGFPNGKYFLKFYELSLKNKWDEILFEYSLNAIRITEEYFFSAMHDYIFNMNLINIKYKRFDLFNKSLIDNKHFLSKNEKFIENFLYNYVCIDYEKLGGKDYYNQLIKEINQHPFKKDLNIFIKYSRTISEYMNLSCYLLYQIYFNDLDYKKYLKKIISIFDSQLNFLIGYNESNSHVSSSNEIGFYSLEFLYLSYILIFLLMKETNFNSINEFYKLIINKWLNMENNLIEFIKKCDDYYLYVFYDYLPYNVNENSRTHIISMLKNKNNRLRMQISRKD